MNSAVIKDSFNFLKKATPRRVLNAARVLGSYYLARATRRPAKPGMPIAVSIEPTTSCNLRCPECPSGLRAFSRPTGMLENDFFRKTIGTLSFIFRVNPI